jgi:type I restriction enzyme S subunit
MREDWVKVELGKVCFTTSGGTPSRRNKEFYEGAIPWVKSGELDKGIIYDTEEHISEDAIKNSSAKIFPEGTLLIALYGATIGKLAFLGVEAATNQAICGIFKSQVIESKYLYNFLLNRRQKLISQGTGGAQPNISQTILKKLEVPLAPLPIQRAIVTKIENLFTSLDKGIADLKKAQEQLKVYRQAVLKKAFEGHFTNRKEKEGELPEGWKWVKLGEVTLSMKNGIYKPSNFYGEQGIACLRMYNIDKGKILWFDIKRMVLEKQDIDEYSLIKGDLLVNRVNSRELVGKTATIKGFIEPVIYESKNIRVRLDLNRVNSDYINYWFLIKANEYFNSNAQQTVGMASINQKQLFNFEFPLPPSPAEQHAIVREIESRLSVCDKIEQSITETLEKSEALRQSILRKAFEGKLLSEAEIAKCKQEADYEPASVLLEQIKKEKHGK